MSAELKLEKFEGPLDLLLQLIDQEKLSITEVAISKVTEQFFLYLDKLEEDRPEKLADFLVVATKLIHLKSHSLLRYAMPETEDNGPALADQLKLYKQYVDASRTISSFWEQGKIAYGRIEPPIKNKEFALPSNVNQDNLYKAMTGLLRRLKPVEALPKVTIDHSVSVKQKIDVIRNLLKGSKEFSFNTLLSSTQNKSEVIMNFLAVLELLKEKSIFVKQNLSFDDMLIVKNK